MLDVPTPPEHHPSNADEVARSPGLTSLYSLHPLHGSMAAPLSPSGVVTENTPLIASTYSTVGEYLDTRAQHMLQQAARNELQLNDPEDVDMTHEFASALYALHIVERHDRARGSARAAAYRASETARVRAELKDYAVGTLDMALAYLGTGDEDKDDDDDDVLVVTRPLALKPGKATNVAALLSHHTTPGAVIEHPLVRALLPRAWSRSRRSRQTPGRGLRSILDSAVTPSRAHFIELFGQLVFLALTFVTALVPDTAIGPDTSLPTTIVWCVWAWASFLGVSQATTYPTDVQSVVDAFSRRRGPSSTAHLLLMLPAQLSGMLIFIWRDLAVFLRVLAIPMSTLAIVLPSCPSLPFLTPQKLLPLSTLLGGILARGAKATALLVPLSLGLWAIYAFSLNGKVWAVMESEGDVDITGNGDPIDVGRAPFETRVALLVTLVLVIVLSACLSIIRAMAPGNDTHDGTWEAEYGKIIAHTARRALAAGVARYLPASVDAAPASVPLPVPLNVLMLPYDILNGGWKVVTLGRGNPVFALRRARGWISLGIVAAGCMLITPIALLMPKW